MQKKGLSSCRMQCLITDRLILELHDGSLLFYGLVYSFYLEGKIHLWLSSSFLWFYCLQETL